MFKKPSPESDKKETIQVNDTYHGIEMRSHKIECHTKKIKRLRRGEKRNKICPASPGSVAEGFQGGKTCLKVKWSRDKK